MKDYLEKENGKETKYYFLYKIVLMQNKEEVGQEGEEGEGNEYGRQSLIKSKYVN